MRKSIVFVIGLFVIGLLFLVGPQSVEKAQAVTPSPTPQPISPTFGVIAPCPSCANPSETPAQTTPKPSGTEGSPTGVVISAAPTAATNPCESGTTSITASKKHKKSTGGISGFFEQLIKFLIELINRILQMFGGGQIPVPGQPGTGNPEPTKNPEPTSANPNPNPEPTTGNPEPTKNPCAPTQAPEPTGSGTNPTIPPVTGPAPTLTTFLPAPTGSTSKTCTNPVFTTSDTNGGWSNGGYYVHNNMWNAGVAGPETLYACAYNNWYVDSTQPDTTEVKVYPNVHLDINNLNGAPWNNYKTITSTFAGKGPGVGIYNVAYDLWLNGVGFGNGHTEVMIWTENLNQRPLGSVKAQLTSSGMTFDIWHYNSGGANVVSFVAKTTMPSGNLNLKEMIDYAIAQGMIPANPTVNQIGFGVEICSTNNTKQRFTFTDFSVTMN